MENCPFCPMFEGKTGIIDIEPLNPVVPGHRIVIPSYHVPDFTTDPTVSAAVMGYAAALGAKIGDCNLITSKGPAATQTVPHLHVHIVPRKEGDDLKLPWTGQKKITPHTEEKEG